MSVILPGATLGVVGGGQLGRMFVHAAQRMGYLTAVLDPDPISPAGSAAHYHIQGDTNDQAAWAQLMQRCDAITTEFENVNAAALHSLGQQRVVAPSAQCVAIAQNRSAEKAMLNAVAQQNAMPQAGPVRYAAIDQASAIESLAEDFFPGLLKTATLGYDGKGQVKVGSRAEAMNAFAQLGQVPCVLEQYLDLAAECSVLLARSAAGEIAMLTPARNTHVNGILMSSEVFAGHLPPGLIEQAQAAATQIALHMQYVGVLCVEFFVLRDAQGHLTLRVNEIAPRPHNSAHWSIEGASQSQFELQVRTLCGLPLPAPTQRAACVMLNLLGDLWQDAQGQERTPPWEKIWALPYASLHLYGKAQARKGRKMGHVTIAAPDAHTAMQQASAVAQILGLPYRPAA